MLDSPSDLNLVNGLRKESSWWYHFHLTALPFSTKLRFLAYPFLSHFILALVIFTGKKEMISHCCSWIVQADWVTEGSNLIWGRGGRQRADSVYTLVAMMRMLIEISVMMFVLCKLQDLSCPMVMFYYFSLAFLWIIQAVCSWWAWIYYSTLKGY